MWHVRLFTFPDGKHIASWTMTCDEAMVYEMAASINRTEELTCMVDWLPTN